MNILDGSSQTSETFSQVIPIDPLPTPITFTDPFGDEPKDSEVGYYLVYETISGDATLNGNKPLPLTEAEISGKHLIVEQINSIPYASYNNRTDLSKITIIADLLEIKSPLTLHQTTVEIYARQVIFSNDGTIVTTPLGITALPVPKPDQTPGDGILGLEAGSLKLYVETLNFGNPTTVRFILKGGAGQPAGPGLPPMDGAPMATLPTEIIGGIPIVISSHPGGNCGLPPPNPDPNYANSIVYHQMGGNRPIIDGIKSGPNPGHDGIPGGHPGEGGTGGDLRTNFDLSKSIFDNTGGLPGIPYQDIKTPSNPGHPNPAYHVYCYNGNVIPDHVDVYYGKQGQPATSPQPISSIGQTGRYIKEDNPLGWVQPQNIEAVLLYAEDLFLSRRPGEAAKLFSDYANIVNKALATLPIDSSIASSLNNLLQRLNHRQTQVALGMDYFGHPAGWVPLLSLEITMAVYKEDIKSATDTIYLNYWITQKIKIATERSKVLVLLLKSASDQLEKNVGKLNFLLSTSIPTIESALNDIANAQSLLAQKLALRESQLKAIADSQAAEAAQAAKGMASLRLFAAVLTLVPVAQPAGAVFGAALNSIANSNDLWSTVKNVSSAYMVDEKYIDSFNKLIIGLNALDFSSGDSLSNSLNTSPISQDKSQTKDIIATNVFSILSKASDLLGQKAKDTVPADLASQLLAQYEADDPEYQDYINESNALLLKKKETFSVLQDLQQQVAVVAQNISIQMDMINNSILPLRDANLAANTSVLPIVGNMRREAEQRLRYYLYLMALAYEYRLLKPYTKSLVINLDEKQLENAFAANENELTADQANALMLPYTNVLSQIAEDIITAYDEQQMSIEQQQVRLIRLNVDELKRLGGGQKIEINISKRPEFENLSQENLRLVSLSLESMTIGSNPSNITTLDILMRHSGVSLIKSGVKTYGFRHMGYDGQPFLTWSSTIDLKTKIINTATPSLAAKSLLQSLVSGVNLELFAAPALDATIIGSIEQGSTGIQFTDITLTVSYTFIQTS